jgi:4-amino-4-deoxychorismate lyase
LAYGDGVFRTFPMRGGKPLLWDRQYAKLAADCAALRITCPAVGAFERDLAAIAMNDRDCVIKIMVTRGSAQRGYAIPAAEAPTRVVIASALPDHPPHCYERGVRAHLCRLRLAAQPALAGIKHLNRLENVLARAEWNDPGVAEGLLCDAWDNVIGGTMSNLFLVKDSALATPDLARCGVAGVTRERVIELARDNKIPLRTANISIDELLGADELFVTNSVIGVWQIAALDRRTWTPGDLTAQMRSWLDHVQDR